MTADHRVAIYSSENRANIPIYPLDTFVPTDAGTEQLQSASTALPPEALEVLVLVDTTVTVGDLEQKLPHLEAESLRNVLRALIAGGLVRAPTISESDGTDFDALLAAFDVKAEPPESATVQGAQASAEREADDGEPHLERSGYYVSIARRAMQARRPQSGERFDVLVVEDDPDMAALVKYLLEQQSFAASVAADRDEVVARLRRTPPPDLIILDVVLPNTNGFEILQKLKSHPVLRNVPVIMLTAEAKRESVARGLVAGADGYITKPFERAALLAGVNAVLGLS